MKVILHALKLELNNPARDTKKYPLLMAKFSEVGLKI